MSILNFYKLCGYSIIAVCMILFCISIIWIHNNSKNRRGVNALLLGHCSVLVLSIVFSLYTYYILNGIQNYLHEPIGAISIYLYQNQQTNSDLVEEIINSFSEKEDWDTYYDKLAITIEHTPATFLNFLKLFYSRDYHLLFTINKRYVPCSVLGEAEGVLSVGKSDGHNTVRVGDFSFVDGELASQHTDTYYYVKFVYDGSLDNSNGIRKYKVIESKYLEMADD